MIVHQRASDVRRPSSPIALSTPRVLSLFLSCVLSLFLVLTTSCVAQTQDAAPLPKQASLLGAQTRLVLSCKNVIESLTWWSRIGFRPAGVTSSRPDSVITLTDGQVTITLIKDPLPSPIMMFASANIKALKDSLDQLEIATTVDVKGPTLGEIRLVSPNGVHIAVRPGIDEPMIPMPGDSNMICGKLTELSVGTSYIKREVTFWEKLNFTTKRSGKEPYPFHLLTDGSTVVGLHENRDIPTLSLTYFAKDMRERIDRLRKSGITFSEEIPAADGAVANVIMLSPEGTRVQLFEGEQ